MTRLFINLGRNLRSGRRISSAPSPTRPTSPAAASARSISSRLHLRRHPDRFAQRVIDAIRRADQRPHRQRRNRASRRSASPSRARRLPRQSPLFAIGPAAIFPRPRRRRPRPAPLRAFRARHITPLSHPARGLTIACDPFAEAAHDRIAFPHRGALIENPAACRHISSDASTSRSTRVASDARRSRRCALPSSCSSSACSAARRRASSTVARVVEEPRARLARARSCSSISMVVRFVMCTSYRMRYGHTNSARA